MVTLIQLEYIVAVDTYRHFVTAAEKCFVTQPTLSMQIKKLEASLGVIIFDRSKQPIIPTDIGMKIIRQARIILAESKAIEEIIDDYNNIITGTLTIGIIPSIAPYLLPLFIGKFAKTYPHVKIKIVELLSEEIIAQLHKDLIDVGILATPLHEKGIVEKPVFYEKMFLYIHKDHPLAKQHKVQPQDIATKDIRLLAKGHCFRTQIINLCDFQEKELEAFPFHYESGSIETLKKLVEKEGGYTLVPELALNKDHDKNVIIKEVTGEPPLREVSLVFSRNYAKKRLLVALEKSIQDRLPEEIASRLKGNVVEWR